MNNIYIHKNLMAQSILCTLFCCLITGIIAIVYASKANELYASSLIGTDETLKNNLLLQAQEKNKKAQNMITLSIVLGIAYFFINVIVVLMSGADM